MKPRIQSVGRAAALVEAMSGAEWVPLRVLAEQAGIRKTTAWNLLGALVDVGWVEHDRQRGAYRLGLPYLTLGRAVERRLDLATTLRPHLMRLWARTRETVNLALPGPTDATIVDSLEGSRSLRVSSYMGTRANYHSTACGRTLLAWQPDFHRQTVYEFATLDTLTPNTVTDTEAIERILEETRATGWALEIEENEIGSACVAAPIMGHDNVAIAAVSVAGPVARINAATAEHYAELLTDQLAQVRDLPGWPPGTVAPESATPSRLRTAS